MAIYSPERQELEALISREQPPRDGRFDPTLIQEIDSEEGLRPIYLKATRAFSAIPDVGNYCIALFSYQGPKISKGPSDAQNGIRHTEGIIHGQCDRGVLVGRGVFELLVPTPDVEVPTVLVPAQSVKN